MGERLTRREVAERFGVTTQRISNMISKGELPVGSDGKIDWDVAQSIRGSFDPAKVQGQQFNKVVGGNAAGRKNAKAAPPASDKPGLTVVSGGGSGGGGNQFQQAKTLEAVFKAKSGELKYRQLAGQLVEREVVKHDAHSAGRMIQQRLLGVGNRLAPMIAPMDDLVAIRKLVDQEMREVIEQMQRELTALGREGAESAKSG